MGHLVSVSISGSGTEQHKLSALFKFNMKVLLRERKRHTVRCVASPWGGIPILAGGNPPWPGGYLP